MDTTKQIINYVDYNSEAFHRGFDAGKSGFDSTVPSIYASQPVHLASWTEGWLMGDSERDYHD